MDNIEYKSVTVPVLDVSDRTVTGFAAVTGNVDDGDDLIEYGAFQKTLTESKRRVKHLFNHDAKAPTTAVIQELKEVGRDELPADVRALYPDATGGLQVTRKYLETPRADEIFQGVKAGTYEMSIGWMPVKGKVTTEKREGQSIRRLKEVRLLETSDVVFPMNSATRAVKSLTDPELTARLDIILKAIHAGSSVSETDLDEWQAIMDEMRLRMEGKTAEPEAPPQATPLTDVKDLLLRLEIAERESYLLEG